MAFLRKLKMEVLISEWLKSQREYTPEPRAIAEKKQEGEQKAEDAEQQKSKKLAEKNFKAKANLLLFIDEHSDKEPTLLHELLDSLVKQEDQNLKDLPNIVPIMVKIIGDTARGRLSLQTTTLSEDWILFTRLLAKLDLVKTDANGVYRQNLLTAVTLSLREMTKEQKTALVKSCLENLMCDHEGSIHLLRGCIRDYAVAFKFRLETYTETILPTLRKHTDKSTLDGCFVDALGLTYGRMPDTQRQGAIINDSSLNDDEEVREYIESYFELDSHLFRDATRLRAIADELFQAWDIGYIDHEKLMELYHQIEETQKEETQKRMRRYVGENKPIVVPVKYLFFEALIEFTAKQDTLHGNCLQLETFALMLLREYQPSYPGKVSVLDPIIDLAYCFQKSKGALGQIANHWLFQRNELYYQLPAEDSIKKLAKQYILFNELLPRALSSKRVLSEYCFTLFGDHVDSQGIEELYSYLTSHEIFSQPTPTSLGLAIELHVVTLLQKNQELDLPKRLEKLFQQEVMLVVDDQAPKPRHHLLVPMEIICKQIGKQNWRDLLSNVRRHVFLDKCITAQTVSLKQEEDKETPFEGIAFRGKFYTYAQIVQELSIPLHREKADPEPKESREHDNHPLVKNQPGTHPQPTNNSTLRR